MYIIYFTRLYYYLKYIINIKEVNGFKYTINIKKVNGLKYNYGYQMRRLSAGCAQVASQKKPT